MSEFGLTPTVLGMGVTPDTSNSRSRDDRLYRRPSVWVANVNLNCLLFCILR